MAEEKHPCEDGLTEKCFLEFPIWAKRAFAIKVMNVLVPAQITRRLPKGLFPGLIGPGVILPPGVDFPPGTTIPPGYTFPPGWSVGDPLPPVFGPDPTPGVTTPPEGAIPPIFLSPFQPGPPTGGGHTSPGVTVMGIFTAQNDGRQGNWGGSWNTAHDAASGNLIFPGETEAVFAINAQADGIDRGCVRSFFDFDLSLIPAGATISDCTLTLQSYGTDTCNASIQEGTQSDSLGTGDYDAFTGSTFADQAWVIGSNVFTLNPSGLTYIQSKFGNTAKLCLREYDYDQPDIEPAEGGIFQAGLYWSGAAVAANRPKLTVTYKT